MVHVPPQTMHEKVCVCVYSHLLVDADIKKKFQGAGNEKNGDNAQPGMYEFRADKRWMIMIARMKGKKKR